MGFILTQLFFVFGLNYILDPWCFNNKKNTLRKIIELGASLIFMFLLSCFATGYYRLPYYKAFFTVIDIVMFVFSALLVGYNILFLKKDVAKQGTIALLFYCLFCSQSNISGWFGTCQEYVWHVLEGKVEFTLIGNIVGMALIMLLMLKVDFKKFIFVPKTMLLLSSGYLVFTMANFGIFRLFVLQSVKDAGYAEVLFAVYGTFILLNVLVYLMIYYNAKEYNEKTLEQLVVEGNKNYIEMMQMSEDKYDSVRKINHDVKNQFMMLQMLSKDKKYEELEAYLDSYLSTMSSSIVNLSNSGNKTVDDVINIALLKCEKSGIKLNCQILVPPSLKIKAIDFCSLITNLVDNAINATKKTGKSEIGLEIKSFNNAILVSISNPTLKNYSQRELNNLLLFYHQDSYHGWGLKIIKEIVNKYKGTLELVCKSNVFTANAMLFMD